MERVPCWTIINDIVYIAWPECTVVAGIWRDVKECFGYIEGNYSRHCDHLLAPHQWRSNFRAMAFSLVLCYYRNISSFNVIKIWNLLSLLVAVTVTVLERPLTPLSCGEEEVLSCQVFIWMLAEEVIGGGIKRAGSQRHSPEAMMQPPVAKTRILLTTPGN